MSQIPYKKYTFLAFAHKYGRTFLATHSFTIFYKGKGQSEHPL